MNCKFCQNLCLRISDDYHRCLECHTNFVKNRTYIYHRMNDITYVANIDPSYEYPVIIGTTRDPMLIKLTSVPNITPQNFEQKLKTYLTFL